MAVSSLVRTNMEGCFDATVVLDSEEPPMSDALVGGRDTEPPTPGHEMRLHEGTASTLDAWIRPMSRPAPTAEGRLPPHSPTCAGCGKEHPAGPALEVEASEPGVARKSDG